VVVVGKLSCWMLLAVPPETSDARAAAWTEQVRETLMLGGAGVKRLRGTAVAIYFFAMYVLGGSFGPYGLGMLSDHFAHQAMREAGAAAMTEAFKASGLHSAMYVIPTLAVLASLVLFAASRTVEGDIRKQRTLQGEEAGRAAT